MNNKKEGKPTTDIKNSKTENSKAKSKSSMVRFPNQFDEQVSERKASLGWE